MALTRRMLCLVALVVAVVCLAACASLSVSHLESRPLGTGTSASIAMKFWRFDFTGTPSGSDFVVRGRAHPVTVDLPPWADRVEELTLTAYLRDPAGTVLASAQKSYSPMPLTQKTVVSFEFVLSPAGSAPGDYAVSFGYKAVYGSSKVRSALGVKGPSPAGAVFFAGEGALLKH